MSWNKVVEFGGRRKEREREREGETPTLIKIRIYLLHSNLFQLILEICWAVRNRLAIVWCSCTVKQIDQKSCSYTNYTCKSDLNSTFHFQTQSWDSSRLCLSICIVEPIELTTSDFEQNSLALLFHLSLWLEWDLHKQQNLWAKTCNDIGQQQQQQQREDTNWTSHQSALRYKVVLLYERQESPWQKLISVGQLSRRSASDIASDRWADAARGASIQLTGSKASESLLADWFVC